MSGPWMKWYPSDWRADPKLRMCSLAARGLWADMLALMHEAEPYGHLLVGDCAPSNKQLASLVGASPREVAAATSELEKAGVFSRTDDGVAYSRRMVRDKAKSDKDRQNGKSGGNPNLLSKLPKGVNPPDKAQKPEARSQKKKEDANASSKEKPPKPRAKIVPEDWQPNDKTISVLKTEGFTDEEIGRERVSYIDSSAAKDRKYVRFDQGFREWCRKSREFRGGNAPPHAGKPGSQRQGGGGLVGAGVRRAADLHAVADGEPGGSWGVEPASGNGHSAPGDGARLVEGEGDRGDFDGEDDGGYRGVLLDSIGGEDRGTENGRR